MKTQHLLFTLLFSLLGCFGLQAQTYYMYGQVINISSPTIVSIDANGSTRTVTTDSLGNFSDSVNTMGTTQGYISATVIDCNGNSQRASGSWNPGTSVWSTTVQLDGCPNTPPPPPACKALFSVSQVYQSGPGQAPIPFNVMIHNRSTGSNPTYLWDFGDGSTSTQAKPVHVYSGNGPYKVCLTVTSGSCTDTYCDTVKIDSNGHVTRGAGLTLWVDEYDESKLTSVASHHREEVNFKAYPNPANDQLMISVEAEEGQSMQLEMMTLTGKVVLAAQEDWTGSPVTLDIQDLAPGIYLLNVRSENWNAVQRIVVE
ncbi:T9SS type A sorting domain-containing protein [bacterium SCSIO 12741]|nr:T9SS type A sorting domain-containing protein [bacterium SCSIO 12741]